MRMTVWDPFRSTRRIPGFWDDDFSIDWNENELDMYEEEDNFIVKVKAPGFDEKNVEITLEDNTLTVTGKTESEEEEEDKKKKYYKKEIRSQSFTRTVQLPRKVESEKIDASFRNGMLTIKLPKAEEVKPRTIKIKPEK